VPRKDPQKRKADGARWRANNAEKSKRQIQNWRRDHPGAVAAHSRQARARNPEKAKAHARKQKLKSRYGISDDEYDRMFAAQNGVCAICRKPEMVTARGLKKPKRLAIDHDHLTGKQRMLLCHNCNLGIGLLGDDAARLRAAADYLEKHS
jgi:hypothetical protein